MLLSSLIASCAAAPQGVTGTMTVQSEPNLLPKTSQIVSPQKHEAYFQFMLAVHDELSRNVDAAKDKYKLALASDPSSSYLHARMAALHAGQAERDTALRHIEAALMQPNIDVNTHILLADVLVKIGLHGRAVDLYDDVIQQRADIPDVFVKKGILLLGLNKIDSAEAALQRSIDLRPNLPIAYYHLGRVALARDDPERAIQYFERAIAGKRDFLPAYMTLARVHEHRGAISEAIRIYRATLDTVQQPSPLIQAELVRLYLRERSYKPALVLLEEILEDDPHNLEALLRIGLIHIEQKEFEKAATRLQAVLSQRPNDVMVRDYLGLVLEQNGKHEKAIEHYQRVLTIDDQYLDTLFHLGHLYYRLGNFTESVSLLRKAVQLEPQRIDIYLVLALGLTKLKQYHDAIAVLEQGIALDSEVPDLHYYLGIVYEKLNQADELIARMKQVIALDPAHADALNYLGYYYVEREIKLDEAMGLIKRAVSLQPDNGYYVDSLAWAHYKMGRAQEALVQLKRAITLVPNDPVIVQHLGEVYLTLGYRDEARKAWERSLELDPDNQELRDAFREQGFGHPDTGMGEEGI